jgi:uncharacterized protein YndB with AHSA1/START domain
VSAHHIDASAVAAAPPEVVWARVADITTWSTWGAWDETTRVREGDPAPDGVGALRQFRRGRRIHVEEVVAFEPPSRLAYEVRSGLPVRGYHAELTLTPLDDGTRISWIADFEGTNPLVGWIVDRVLRKFFPDAAQRLARAAEADVAKG